MPDTKLSPDAVRSIMMRVLFQGDEVPDNSPPDHAVVVEGIRRNYAFHPERLAEATPEISALLAQLPHEFHLNGGGGWSFLNACVDASGEQWTGSHATMEELFVLGIGAGLASYQLPREIWSALPGGMPYLEVHPLASDASAAAHA